MSQVTTDDYISVAIGPTKPISEKKIAQLADARVKAIDSRKRRQKQRLEEKLRELRSLGDMPNEQLAKVCELLVVREAELRGKQNDLTEKLNQHLDNLTDEINVLRKQVDRIITRPQPPPQPPRVPFQAQRF
eukprot:7260775-Prymnesium_polylepis.1